MGGEMRERPVRATCEAFIRPCMGGFEVLRAGRWAAGPFKTHAAALAYAPKLARTFSENVLTQKHA